MKADLVRVGPVHFQSLQDELAPVGRYLNGRLLDAGCGDRDIGAFLRAHDVTEIVRFDASSDDPDVVLGALESLPFPDCAFDSVLCNAVLEHVVDAGQAISELGRVTRPGGHVVVAVPFLQPYHPCPGDYRRYTASGLAELGRSAGLDVVAVLPVHSFAQTLGWLLWEHALEKGGRLRRVVARVVAYLSTRVWNKTDPSLRRTANTFQAVFRRPHPNETRTLGDWRGRAVPAAADSVPTMLVPDELRLLNHLADSYYTGAGAIVDAGSFLGGSTVALADGLQRYLARTGRPPEKLIHSYDRFEVEPYTVGRYFPKSTPAGSSFRADFERHTGAYRDLIEIHAGNIEDHPWTGGPVEILFVDVAKQPSTSDWITWQFFSHLIPGHSIVVQQDYLYHHYVGWLHVTMEFYGDYFEYVCDTTVNSVAFRCVAAIPPEVLRRHTVDSLSRDKKAALMSRAASRFEGVQRETMLAARQHFLDMLDG